jgi:glutamyl-tRNA reductase
MELYWGDGIAPENIVRHLYRVASGLESALLGERAIQGQLKTAYRYALDKYRLSSSLNRLFQTAIYTGKRSRNETKISEGAVSHSQITVDILKLENVDLRNKTVCIIGVNKLTENILKYLVACGANSIFLANRNMEKATALAAKYNGTAIYLDKKLPMLRFTDILICATSAPHIIVHRHEIPQDKKMLIFDLAFPRDVDEHVRAMATVKLFDLEDMEKFASRSLTHRNNEVNKVERIIEEEIAEYYRWQNYRLKNNIHI